MKLSLPPAVELSIELDDSTPSIYLEQGTDVIQIHPKHVGAVCRALDQAASAWYRNQPVRTPKTPYLSKPSTKGEW